MNRFVFYWHDKHKICCMIVILTDHEYTIHCSTWNLRCFFIFLSASFLWAWIHYQMNGSMVFTGYNPLVRPGLDYKSLWIASGCQSGFVTKPARIHPLVNQDLVNNSNHYSCLHPHIEYYSVCSLPCLKTLPPQVLHISITFHFLLPENDHARFVS